MKRQVLRGQALAPPSGATGEPRPTGQRTQRAEAHKRNTKRGMRSECSRKNRKEKINFARRNWRKEKQEPLPTPCGLGEPPRVPPLPQETSCQQDKIERERLQTADIRESAQPENSRTNLNKINYNRPIRIASLNMQGNKLDDAVQFMRKMKIDIMAIQGTTIAINHTFNIEEYTVITSTSNTQVAKPMVIETVNWKKQEQKQTRRT